MNLVARDDILTGLRLGVDGRLRSPGSVQLNGTSADVSPRRIGGLLFLFEDYEVSVSVTLNDATTCPTGVQLEVVSSPFWLASANGERITVRGPGFDLGNSNSAITYRLRCGFVVSETATLVIPTSVGLL